jgi:hypothetical protein
LDNHKGSKNSAVSAAYLPRKELHMWSVVPQAFTMERLHQDIFLFFCTKGSAVGANLFQLIDIVSRYLLQPYMHNKNPSNREP